jgi:hypothetical protein
VRLAGLGCAVQCSQPAPSSATRADAKGRACLSVQLLGWVEVMSSAACCVPAQRPASLLRSIYCGCSAPISVFVQAQDKASKDIVGIDGELVRAAGQHHCS